MPEPSDHPVALNLVDATPLAEFAAWFATLPAEHDNDQPNCGVCRACVTGTLGIIDAMRREYGDPPWHYPVPPAVVRLPGPGNPAWREFAVVPLPGEGSIVISLDGTLSRQRALTRADCTCNGRNYNDPTEHVPDCLWSRAEVLHVISDGGEA